MASIFQTSRFWLVTWGGLGAAVLVYVIIASSVQPASPDAKSKILRDPTLLVGEMAKFNYAFPTRTAPQISFSSDNGAVSLADFRGKTVLVNLWATWCAPCLRELPSLDALETHLGGARFQVIAIAADPSGPDAARQYLERLKIEHLNLYTDSRLAFASAVGGAGFLPVSILYDAKGREIGRIVGETDWNSKEARRLLEAANSLTEKDFRSGS